MKRTATTLALLAGLGGGGCATSDTQTARAPQAQQQTVGGFGTVTHGKQVDNLQGPMGEPVMAVRGATPGGVRTASATTLVGQGSPIRPAGGTNVVTANDRGTGMFVPGVGGTAIRQTNYISGIKESLGQLGTPVGGGGGAPNMPNYGIVPVPTMGPPGAVAYVGPMAGAVRGPMVTGRSSINFTGPAGMKVTWQLPDGSFNDEANALTAPKEYNFLQGQVYRLRLSSILPDFPGKSFYPTLEVAPGNPKSLTFLSHSSVPLTFAADDFAQAKAGNLVVKVIYLPDPINQDFSTVVGAEEVVSTRLEPGADPVAEAQRRGTILAVIRMGNIDLENRVSPSMTAPAPGAGGPPPGFGPPPGAGGPLMVPPGPPLSSPTPVPPKPTTDTLPPKKVEVAPPKTSALPLAPVAPANPPGTASVNTSAPAALPALPLPPAAPTDLPPAPLAPVAPPKAPTKSK